MAVSVESPEVAVAGSEADAVSLFGDGEGVVVIAGGTIVVPEMTHGRLRPRRALLLRDAGLAGVRREDGLLVLGATTPVSELEDLPQPVGETARHVADREIRAQATVGGNLCAPPGAEAPRGDLQAALLAVGAQVRTAGAGGERTEDLEEALQDRFAGRLLLDVRFAEPQAGARAAVRRPHAHAYTVLSVTAARTADGVRIAASGAAPRALRLRGAEEAFAASGDPEAAAARALEGAQPADDALASAWYRTKTLPVLVRRALADLQPTAQERR